MTIIQNVSFFVTGLSLIVWGILYLRAKNYRGYVLAILIWLVHVAAFYMMLQGWFGAGLEANAARNWSTAVRLHSLLTVAGVGVVILIATRHKR